MEVTNNSRRAKKIILTLARDKWSIMSNAYYSCALNIQSLSTSSFFAKFIFRHFPFSNFLQTILEGTSYSLELALWKQRHLEWTLHYSCLSNILYYCNYKFWSLKYCLFHKHDHHFVCYLTVQNCVTEYILCTPSRLGMSLQLFTCKIIANTQKINETRWSGNLGNFLSVNWIRINELRNNGSILQ